MGICESTQNNENKENKESYNIKPLMKDRIVDQSNVIPLDMLNKINKSVCKINYNNFVQGIGFFMVVNNNKCLITNYRIINENTMGIIINIQIYNNKFARIKINDRYIQYFKEMDITVTEIKESDNIINDVVFLDYDPNYINGYHQYKDIDVITLQYIPNGTEIKKGKITAILNNYEFQHNIDTSFGTSGSPIILIDSLKVIGIHKEGNNFLSINYGSFIGEIFNNNKSTQNKANNNYIIGEIYISEKQIGKKIRIINSYEESQRVLNFEIEEKYKNEKEIKECIIEINGVKYQFSYFHKFQNPGKYIIKYHFKNILTNCRDMFAECSSLTTLNLSNLNSQNITNMNGMFYECSSLTNIDLSNLNTQNVTDMKNLFCDCSSLVNLDLSSFNTKKVNNMSGMLSDCSSLTNINLSNFNTQNVNDMKNMFRNCSSLTNLNLSNFNTQNVTDMGHMFSSCSSLRDLNISNFNTQNVTDMRNMFSNCSSLTHLDLSNFSTQNVAKMVSMFSNCSSLTNLNLYNFNTQNVADMWGMFYNCKNLKSLITKDSKILKELNNMQ